MLSIFHWPPAKVSIGIKVDHLGAAYLAVAACRPPDIFTKARATAILTSRLENPAKRILLGNFAPDENLSAKLLGPARDAVRALKRRRSVKEIINGIAKNVDRRSLDVRPSNRGQRSPLAQQKD